MWNSFVCDNDVYIIKINHCKSYNVILTNFVDTWSKNFSEDDIVNICKELNPLITTDNETYIERVLSILNCEINNINIAITRNENDVKLEYKTEVANIEFKFTFNLNLTSNLTLCEEVLVPTIQTIQYLEKRQKQLCELLRKKDEEIQQHIFENGDIKRKTVKTSKFNQEEFDQCSSKSLCCTLFSKSEEFSKTLISKYGCVEPELINVKKEERKASKNKIPIAKQILHSKSKRPKIETSAKKK